MNHNVFEELKCFIEKQLWKSDFLLTKTTRIQEDMGITGTDAVDFIVAYGKHFNVDVSSFMAADYFDAEGGLYLPFKIPFLKFLSAKNLKTLTLGDLEKGIIVGKLDDTIIESAKDH
jgi:acyl carrier protein